MRSQEASAIRVQLAAALQLSLPSLRAAGSEAEGSSDTEDRQTRSRADPPLSPACLALPLPPILHFVQDPGGRFRPRFPAKQVMEEPGLEVGVRGRGENPLSS